MQQHLRVYVNKKSAETELESYRARAWTAARRPQFPHRRICSIQRRPRRPIPSQSLRLVQARISKRYLRATPGNRCGAALSDLKVAQGQLLQRTQRSSPMTLTKRWTWRVQIRLQTHSLKTAACTAALHWQQKKAERAPSKECVVCC